MKIKINPGGALMRPAMALLIAVCSVCGMRGSDFIDYSRPAHFLETQAHAFVGGSYLTENYRSVFPVIRELDTTMGVSYGAGAGATLLFREYFGAGTEINFLVGHNRADIFTSNFSVQSASNLYLRNSYYYINIPLFLTWRFNLAPGVRWNVDFGAYYAYGVGGSQKQTLYRSLVNELGQLVYQEVHAKPDFFNDGATFQNSFRRGDFGAHVATGLTFHRHFFIGARVQAGLKNIAFVENGILTPKVHTVTFLVQTGWKF